jgi:hypothetical protein
VHPVRSTLITALGVASTLVAFPATSAAQDCPNADIRAAQGPAVEALPDCMALEMVSPPAKFLQGAEGASVSLDGSMVQFRSRGALGDAPGLIELFRGDAYLATRGQSGWNVESMLPPTQANGNWTRTWNTGVDPGRSLTPDFSRWLTFAATDAQNDEGVAQAFQAGTDGFFTALSPLLAPIDGLHGDSNVRYSSFEGASADHSQLFFKPGDLQTMYLPGDPSPSGTSADRNTYVARLGSAGAPTLELLTRDGDGKVWGGRCGSRVGGAVQGDSALANGRNQGAVSADGTRVLFMTRPGQEGDAACDSATNKLRVMLREQAAGGPLISQLYSSECGRVTPACDTTDGDDLFQGASVDQSKVYFLSSRQLASTDLDGIGVPNGCQGFVVGGCDLYLYDSTRPMGQRLTQVSAGDETNPSPGAGAEVHDGIAAISGDGSHVYFVARGVLTTDPSPSGATAVAGEPNFYVYQRAEDDPDGDIAYIGAADVGDDAVLSSTGLWGRAGTFKDSAYPVPVTGKDEDGVEVGGDGHVLVFRSVAPFTADDTDNGHRDVFRYDADAHELVRVSKAAVGGMDNGEIDVEAFQINGSLPGTAFAEFKRWVSEDGDTITLQTTEGLAADDTNALSDDYIWRDGELHRLPGSSRTSVSLQSIAGLPSPALSHDGSTIAFESFEQLLAADGDTVTDVYVARVGGGFHDPAPVAVCEALTDGCQGDGVAPLDMRSNTADAGSGNTSPKGRVRLALLTISAAGRRSAARSGRMLVRVRASSAGDVSLAARARIGKQPRRRVGSASKNAAKAGVVVLDLRLAKSVRDRLDSGHSVRVTLVVSQPGARTRTATVRLPGAGR